MKERIEVYSRRVLLWFAAGYVLALILACYLLPGACLPWVFLLPLAGAGAAALLRRRGEGVSRALAGLLLPVLCGAALGGFRFWGDRVLTVDPAEALVGETRSVSALVTRYAEVHPEYACIRVRSRDGTVPHVPMLIYDYAGDAGLDALRPGDRVTLQVKLLSASTRYGEDSDYYLSGGVRLRGSLTAPPEVAGRSSLAFLFAPLALGEAIKAQALACFPEDVAGLMKALLTGDRTEYYADDSLYSAMRAAGFTHIIAVSGMHVGFLVTMVQLVTRSRRRVTFVGIPLILAFMAMAGFTPSVTRAGIMQLILLAAPLAGREDDPPTSLAAAGLLILLFNPMAIASQSFQLSFAAMAGLITVTPRVFSALTRNPKGRSRLPRGIAGQVLHWILSAFAAGLGAAVFTTPLTALWYGYVPLYGLVTNLLCLWPMSTAFGLGYGVCLLGALWQPLGMFTGWITGWLPRYVAFTVRHIARWPLASVYTGYNLGGWWLVFLYVLFPGSYALRGGERWRPVLPVCCALSALALISCLLCYSLPASLQVTAVDVGQGQSLIATTDSATVMIDCGGGPGVNAGDRAADWLLRSGRDRVDLLILTHFHADHAGGVERLMNRVQVARLAVAAEYEPNDYSEKLLSLCARQGTEVFLIAADTAFQVGRLALTVYAPLSRADVNEACLLIRGDYGSFGFLVTGDVGADVEQALTEHTDLGDMELLVAGHHGAAGSTGSRLLDEITPEAVFISVGAGNRYGHPAAAVLERLEARNIRIFRTDEDGTVSLTVGAAAGREDYG